VYSTKETKTFRLSDVRKTDSTFEIYLSLVDCYMRKNESKFSMFDMVKNKKLRYKIYKNIFLIGILPRTFVLCFVTITVF
jgi:hypothetical protein